MRQAPFSVCEFTTPNTTFEEDIALARSVSATGLGVCEARLPEGQDEINQKALDSSGLKASGCIPNNISPLPCEPAFPGPSAIDERVELIGQSLQRFAPFRPEVVVLVTGNDDTRLADDCRAVAIEGLREAARMAAELGITIGLEPIRRDLGLNISTITTIPEALDMIEEIGAPNVGITFDVYHLWDSKDVVQLAETYAGMINSVHISDWREPRGWSDRTFPGDGIIDLVSIIEALERGGYKGFYDLEIFAEDGLIHDGDAAVWRLSPMEIVRRGRNGFGEAWAAATARLSGAAGI